MTQHINLDEYRETDDTEPVGFVGSDAPHADEVVLKIKGTDGVEHERKITDVKFDTHTDRLSESLYKGDIELPTFSLSTDDE